MKAAALILLTAACLAGCETENKRKDQVGETVVGQSIARAKDEVCTSNLRTIRQALEVYKTSEPDATNPTDLSVLRLSKATFECPIDHKPYKYDAAEGTIQCKHLGHEGF